VETLQDIIAALGKLEDTTPDQIADALKSGQGAVYQAVYNRGHEAGKEELNGRLTELGAEAKRERKRAETAEAKVAKMEEDQPDVAQIRKEYEEEQEALKAQLEEAKKSGDQRVRSILRSRAVSDLKARLVTKYGIDADYAEVQAQRAEARINPEPVEGKEGEYRTTVTVEGKSIPMQADDPLEALAQEIDQRVDARFKTGNVDTGGRTGGSSGGAGGDRFSQIREEVQKRQEGQQRQSAAERMGLAGKS
ncbi:MAG TPA: hypothetical protein VK966_04315, partial [Longimicrobiales bacterium]|nr:hypothetical protein [Longimicrobiales bacterium]